MPHKKPPVSHLPGKPPPKPGDLPRATPSYKKVKAAADKAQTKHNAAAWREVLQRREGPDVATKKPKQRSRTYDPDPQYTGRKTTSMAEHLGESKRQARRPGFTAVKKAGGMAKKAAGWIKRQGFVPTIR
jgi:hypothetical protein